MSGIIDNDFIKAFSSVEIITKRKLGEDISLKLEIDTKNAFMYKLYVYDETTGVRCVTFSDNIYDILDCFLEQLYGQQDYD